MKIEKYHAEVEDKGQSDKQLLELCLQRESEVVDADEVETNTVIDRIPCNVHRFRSFSGTKLVNITAYVTVEE